MRIEEAKTYKNHYAVREIDNMDINMVCVFEKKKDAKEWIKKHSYKGMSIKYEIAKITNSKETNWRGR